MSIWGQFGIFVLIMVGIVILAIVISTIHFRLTNDMSEEELAELFEDDEEEGEIIQFSRAIEDNYFDTLSIEDQIAYIERENEEFKKELSELRSRNRKKKKESRYAFIRFFPWLWGKLSEKFEGVYFIIG